MIYELMYYLSSIVTNLVNPRVVIKEVEIVRKDPHGFMPDDITFIKKSMKKYKYTHGDTLERVAYHAGQTDLLDFIEDKLIQGRRIDVTIR